MGNPVTGMAYLIQGFGLIFKPGLRRYVLLPLLINFIIFAALVWFGASQFEILMNWIMPELPEWLQWLDWILWTLFALSALLIFFFAFSLLANLVGAPFNGLLAEAVEFYVTGKRPEQAGGWKAIITDLIPTLVDELRKIGYAIVLAIPFLILFVIPVINIIAPFAWLAFTAWMLAVEYTDYPMGNHGLKLRDQRELLKRKRLLSLGFGGATTIATMMPLVNFLVMPAAVAGATLMWVKHYQALHGERV